MTLSAAEIYSLLEAYPLKVTTDEGVEFFCKARCLGFHRGMQEVATLTGFKSNGDPITVSLYRDQLERGARRKSNSSILVYDRDGLKVQLEFHEPVMQFYGNHH